MPSLGRVEGFAPHLDLDTTEHDLRTEPSMSQELLDYLTGHRVTDLGPGRPVIRPTAASRTHSPPGPQAHFQRYPEVPLEELPLHQDEGGVVTKFLSVIVPWELCDQFCSSVDYLFRHECEMACVEALGMDWRVSPGSSPLGARLVLGLRFGPGTWPLVVERVAASLAERIRADPRLMVPGRDAPLRLRCTEPIHPDFVHVHEDEELLLKSSL